MTREVFERGHAAAVLLYDPARDRVVLIEQFRPGAYAAGFEPWLIAIVAGILEEGETPESVVSRAAEAEAGCKNSALPPIGTFLAKIGRAASRAHVLQNVYDSWVHRHTK